MTWVTPREAIDHVHNLTSGATPAADLDFPSFASCMPCAASGVSSSAPSAPALGRGASGEAPAREFVPEPSHKRVRVAASGAGGGGRQKAARTADRPAFGAIQGVLQPPEALECLNFSDALQNSMGSSMGGIDVLGGEESDSLFGEFRQLFSENAAPPPRVKEHGVSFNDVQSLGGNISLTEINSASLNEILGSRSFNDLGAPLPDLSPCLGRLLRPLLLSTCALGRLNLSPCLASQEPGSASPSPRASSRTPTLQTSRSLPSWTGPPPRSCRTRACVRSCTSSGRTSELRCVQRRSCRRDFVLTDQSTYAAHLAATTGAHTWQSRVHVSSCRIVLPPLVLTACALATIRV